MKAIRTCGYTMAITTSLLTSFLLLSFTLEAHAKPISENQAKSAVKGWLNLEKRPLETIFGSTEISGVQKCSIGNEADYYIVNLAGGGFVIVSGDDVVEPIIAFSAGGVYDPFSDNPLSAMISGDLPGRTLDAKKSEAQASNSGASAKRVRKAKAKWIQFEAASESSASLLSLPAGSVSDVRVAPLVVSTWGQAADVCSGSTLYNYYTPNNWGSGCVATATAQLLRFYRHPNDGVDSTMSYEFTVAGVPQTAHLRGGDGSGGPYDWDAMPLSPCRATDYQRQQIGALCCDAGVATKMGYTSTGSGTQYVEAKNALVSTFKYSNAVYGRDDTSPTYAIAGMDGMLNTNLDAGLPVFLGVHNGTSGHAVITDGYGFDNSTMYHHINMGWNGSESVWYNLPNMQNPVFSFNHFNACIYNLYITGSGEVISGRITTGGGIPVSGVAVTASISGGTTYFATTNAKGIYAITKVPSNTAFTVSAGKPGYEFGNSKTITTGLSEDWKAYSGNIWGVDFFDTLAHPPAALDTSADVVVGGTVIIPLRAVDDGQPNPPGQLIFKITELPSHGKLSDPAGGIIRYSDLPYALLNNGSQVQYQPCRYYVGSDSFNFKANDGGIEPQGGDSNTATVSINMTVPNSAQIYSEYFSSGLPAGWSIIDNDLDGKTWTSTNPAGRSSSNWSGTFMIVDSNWAGNVAMDEQLVSRQFDFSEYKDIKLTYAHNFKRSSAEIADVDIRVNGEQWTNLKRYQNANASGWVTLDISAIADHQPNVQLRWHYYDANCANFWGIDSVVIRAVHLPEPTEGDFDIDCDVDAVDLAGIISAWLSDSSGPDWNVNYDISIQPDGVINLADMAVFASNWLNQ